MPPRRPACANPLFVEIIENLRDAQPPDSNRFLAYNRAARSMRGYPEVLHDPEDAHKVPFVGPKIVEELVAKVKSSSAGSSSVGSSSVGSSSVGSSSSRHRGVTNPAPPPRTKKSVTNASTNDAQNVNANPTYGTQAAVGEVSCTNIDIFPFCYLTYNQNHREIRVEHREAAHVKVDTTLGFLIEFPRTCQHPLVTEIQSKTTQPQRVLGYLPMEIADGHFPKSTLPLNWINQIPTSSQPIAEASALKRSDTDILAAENARVLKKHKSGTIDPSRQQSTVGTWTINSSGPIQRSSTMPTPRAMASSSNASSSPIATSSQGPMRRTDSAPAASTQGKSRARPRLSYAIPLPSFELDIDIEDPYASAEPFQLRDFDPVIVKSHEYDIVLLLDTREIKSGRDRSGMADGLRRKGVRVEQRALNIGDVCWIAKRKPGYCDNSEHDEIVLDCILERKRLDDLVQSITNGRFHDQKFRLHNTAITKVYYLIEEYKYTDRGWVEQDKSSFDTAIDTVISQTAIADKFQVKETKNINDTIAFYAQLHQYMISMYQNKNLFVIPSQLVKRYNYLKFQKMLRNRYPSRTYLLAYKTFHELNDKSRFLTVRETWARMLLCIHGVSAEKAGILIQKYPTPQSMYEACLLAKQHEEEETRRANFTEDHGGKPRAKKDIFIAEEFLKDLGGNSNRKIGPAVSRSVFNIVMSTQYTEDMD
ncbi:ERCC4 domain-containing protein [Lentinula raphanica]|nr:ERCC4 domain-containing protein [Lentinula raphanica]KAJ3968350.1 ERCC4 domain-containing protein [Lentinula raphanica]